MTPYYEHAGITIYHGDCRDVVPTLPPVDLVLTDPPYPDCHTEAYHYSADLIDVLTTMPCRQLVFWSAKAAFPLDATAMHVWDKECPVTPYEFIAERNGSATYRLFREQFVNNRVLARFHKEDWTGHPSQKPQRLLVKLLRYAALSRAVVLDPFMGSGSTLVAAKRLKLQAVGIEREERYCEIAARRLAQEALPLEVA